MKALHIRHYCTAGAGEAHIIITTSLRLSDATYSRIAIVNMLIYYIRTYLRK